MPHLLSTLIVQNSLTDNSTVLSQLSNAGFIPDWQTVTTESEYLREIDRSWDLILMLWENAAPLPETDRDENQQLTLDPQRALEILHQTDRQIPLIIITDNPSVELAVACMKQGAADYLLKPQLNDLAAKVQQVLPAAENRDRSVAPDPPPVIPGRKRLTTVTKISDSHTSVSTRLSEELFFRNLVEHNSDLIWEVDRNAVYTYVSPNIKQILGYEPEELIGKTPFDFMSPPDALRVAEVWGNLAAKQVPFMCLEHRNRHKTGEDIMLETSGNPIFATREELGKQKRILAGYRGISRNINDRFHQQTVIENLMRETASVTGKSFFTSLVRHLAAALRVRYAFVCELTASDPLKLRAIAAWIDNQPGKPLEYDSIDTPCEVTLKKGQYYCADGLRELFPEDEYLKQMGISSYLGVRLVDTAGKAIGNLCVLDPEPIFLNPQTQVILNIFALRAAAELQRQRAEQERSQLLASLKNNEAKYRTIFAASPIGMATFNLETLSWCTANPRFCQLLGYQETEIKQLTVENITHPPDWHQEIGKLWQLKSGAISSYQLEKCYQTKTGELIPCDLICTAIANRGQNPSLGLAIVQDTSEWKQVEESTRLRDRAIITSTNGIAISDARYPFLPIIYVNPAFEKITGYSAVDVLGQPCWWLLPNHRQTPKWIDSEPPPELSAAIQQQKHCRVVMKNYRQDGTAFWNQLSVSPIYDSEGNLTHFLSIHNDITEIEEAQSFLRLSQERLRYLVASNPAVIYSRKASREYNVTFMSENVLALFGYEVNKFLADPTFWQTQIHPDDRQVISIASSRLFDQGYEAQEYRFRHANGSYIWVRDEQKLIRDEQDCPLEIIGYWADISDRKQTEAALQVAKDKLQAVWDAVPGFVSLISSDLKYIGVNQQLADIFRLSPEEFIGKEIGFLGTSQGFIQFMTEFFASETQEATQEIASGFDGNQKTHLMVTQKYQQETAAVLIGIDITERKQAEEKIQASLREKEVLLKEIHHRVKNNLQVISSLLKMQSRSLNEPKILEMFQESQSRIHSMALIHEKLYQSEDLARINCADYIQNLTSHLYRCYQVSPRSIQLQVNVDRISLSLDAALPCGLIINELVSNALKYAFPNKGAGQIYINLNIDDRDRYTLKVGDNGIGLPPDIDWQNTRSLGLRLVRTLSQQLGATVELDRSHGTMFCLNFTEPNYQKRI